MKYYRLGKFRFGDYWVSLCSISGLLLFSIMLLISQSSPLFALFATIYSLVWIWKILAPNCEQFIVGKDFIITLGLGNSRTIVLPQELTLIVSYVDICPPLVMRTPVGNTTHVLKNKCAISILRNISPNIALDTLHRSLVREYTTSIVQTAFDDYHYLYSFVYEQDVFEQLIAGRAGQIIIPRSLSQMIPLDTKNFYVYLDEEH